MYSTDFDGFLSACKVSRNGQAVAPRRPVFDLTSELAHIALSIEMQLKRRVTSMKCDT